VVRALDLQLTVEFESLQYGDFSIFQDAGRRGLGFLIFLMVGTVKSGEPRHYA